jgi:hypothetical protein
LKRYNYVAPCWASFFTSPPLPLSYIQTFPFQTPWIYSCPLVFAAAIRCTTSASGDESLWMLQFIQHVRLSQNAKDVNILNVSSSRTMTDQISQSNKTSWKIIVVNVLTLTFVSERWDHNTLYKPFKVQP